MLGGLLAILLEDHRSISMLKGSAILLGGMMILIGEFFHPKIRKKAN